ncbi:MAG TPA: metallophosphoesterase [Solirubrobacteraceae bacterium]|nr:metallophosphoesterase [Solirubrobacteraceae bacterium]
MSRSFGLPSHAKAHEQLSKAYPPNPGPQPLPPGAAGRATAAQLGINESQPLTFFVIGDHGGVKAPGPQNAVSYAMQRAAAPAPAFVYSVGDLVYFHGEAGQYSPQFYEPYGHLAAPIVAIPGNHDGDVAEDDSGNPTGRQPLDTFMANFCTQAPQVPPGDPQLEFGRHTQTQPWCDWTLELAAVTIIGLYSNVPEGGIFQTSQTDWLVSELQAAPTDRPVIVTLHHPPLSVDAHHGGSPRMVTALTQGFQSAQRWPQLILTGHVHDYQRFTWELGGHSIPTIVIGNSGYHNLHQLASDAKPGLKVAPGVTFEFGEASEYGFLTLTVSAGTITGSYTGVKPGVMPDGSDAAVSAGKDTFTTQP